LLSGPRQTAADFDAIMHEVQAHNTTRGAAGPTAGTATEDFDHQQGAAAVQTPEEAVRHERTQHKGDEQPPKYEESGVRATGSCTITASAGTVQGIPIRYCRPLHRGDGYTYEEGDAARPPPAFRQGSPRRNLMRVRCR
jgi:hypothetical protein